MTKTIIEHQEFTETQRIPNLKTGYDIGSWQKDYLLREVEFERIKHGKPITYFWSHNIALTTFGVSLSLLAKGYSDLSLISKGEWGSLVLGAVISAILYGIGMYLPNNKKNTMEKIEKFFETATVHKKIIKEQE